MPRMMPDLVVRPAAGRAGQHGEAAGVAGRRSDGPLEPGHRLDVVVEDVGPGVEDGLERRPIALAVRDEHLDGGAGTRLADPGDGLGEGAGPPSARSSRATQVITAWARPIRATASATRAGSSASSGSGRRVSTWQKPQARVHRDAVDHERGRPVGPALVDVGAAGLLAHRDQVEVAEPVLEAEVLVGHGGLDPQPLGLAGRERHPGRRVDAGPGHPPLEGGAAVPACTGVDRDRRPSRRRPARRRAPRRSPRPRRRSGPRRAAGGGEHRRRPPRPW